MTAQWTSQTVKLDDEAVVEGFVCTQYTHPEHPGMSVYLLSNQKPDADKRNIVIHCHGLSESAESFVGATSPSWRKYLTSSNYVPDLVKNQFVSGSIQCAAKKFFDSSDTLPKPDAMAVLSFNADSFRNMTEQQWNNFSSDVREL